MQKRCNLTVFLALVGVVVLSNTGIAQDYFRYPPYGAQRGRMVHRDGVLRSERYRWGNGLTPTGGAVLNHTVDALAPAVVSFVGGLGRRDVDLDELDSRDFQSRSGSFSTRSPARFTAPDDYVTELRRANELLIRTESLVKGGGGASQSSSSQTTTPDASTGDFGNKAKLQELLKKLGDNPFN